MRRQGTLALVALLCCSAARAEDAALVSSLTRNAWYWQARARSDKAEDAWKQVLEAAPDNPEALAALGGYAARSGRRDQARELLARLEKVSPGHPDVPVLRRLIELGPRLNALLAEARKLAHEGRQAEAAAKYKEIFGPPGPPGDLALEYYQTLGGVPGGWEPARDGLRRLVRRAPAEPRFQLALGKLLSYREAARREGIELLAKLSKNPAVGKDATAAWRQALLWLPPADTDVPLLKAYVKAHPGDREVASRIERARKAGTLKEGFAALDRGDLRTAERVFRAGGDDPDARRGLQLIAQRRAAQTKKEGFAALERGDLRAARELFGSVDDADARLGLALVALREATDAQKRQDFDAARALLLRAKELAPQRKDLWAQPLQSATFWGRVRDAAALRAQGRSADAAEVLGEAIQDAPPQDRWNAELALAELRRAANAPAQAEAAYRDVLASKPDQPDALRALTDLLVQQGRYAEALPLNERLAQVAPAKALKSGFLRAQLLRAEATRRRAARDLPGARTALEKARKEDPSDVWVLHDLAGLLLQTGAAGEAEPLVDQLLRLAPDLPEAQVLHARLLVAQGKKAEALLALDALQPQPKDASLQRLRQELEVQVRIPALLAAASGGDVAGAAQGLELLERKVMDRPELAAQVAVAWSRIGERARGVQLMRTAMARAPSQTRGARLELASTLLESGEDAAVTELLASLERETSLTAAERKSLIDLRVAHAVRLADRAREAGRPGEAAALLDPVLRDAPSDPRLLAALARALEQDQPGRAHALYVEVLHDQPRDFGALRGAVDTALALDRLDEAHTLADRAVQLFPAEPQAHLLAARVAQRENDDGAAARAFEQALALRGPEGARLQEAEPGAATTAPDPGAERRAAYLDSGADAALRGQISRELAIIRNRHRPAFRGGFEARGRDGEPGLSRLVELRGTVQVEVPIGVRGRGTLHLAEVELDAGSLQAYAGPRFGSGATPAPDAPNVPQDASGTELALGYEDRNFGVTLGTTPLRFPSFSFVGGVRAQGDVGPVRISAEGSRRMVTESLLSYAGAQDPTTGLRWGGVVQDGGRLELGVAAGPVRTFVFGELHRLVGLRVQDNVRGAAGFGLDLVSSGPFGEVAVGPRLGTFGFERNLRYFTLGHGGYFSPQRFGHVGMSFRWAGGERLRWEAVAEPGWDAFEEERTPMFPLSADPAQQQLFYGGRTQDGASFNGHAQLGWEPLENFELAFSVAAQRAPEFQELRAGIVLRFGGRPPGR